MSRKEHKIKEKLQQDVGSTAQRPRITGWQQPRRLPMVRDNWLHWTGTGANRQVQTQTNGTSKECSKKFWRSQDLSFYDWGWLWGTQNSLRSQTRWQLGPAAPHKEGWGQGIARQRDLETSVTTHRQGRNAGKMGLQSDMGTQWSNRQIESTLCGEGFQTSGTNRILWNFCDLDRGSDLRLGLDWRHHSSIKKHDNDLRCQEGTRSIIPREW